MDSSYHVDRDALLAAVRERDHLVFRFSTITERLFIDFRTIPEEGPAAAVLPAATSMRERMATIRQARPQFPRPKRVNVVAWPLRVGALERLGIMVEIRTRLADLDGFGALRALDEAFAALQHAEEEEMRRAITGEGYQTLWEPARA